MNYWTDEITSGGEEVTIPAPLEEIPLFVKAGSVIPFTRSDLDTLAADLAGGKYQTLDNSLIWKIFRCRQASAASFASYDGAKVSVEQNTNQVQVKGESPKVRQYEVVVTLTQSPCDVLLPGHRLERLENLGAFPGKEGWTFDPATKTLHVRFLKSDFSLRITI